jgi:hypothetical protein
MVQNRPENTSVYRSSAASSVAAGRHFGERCTTVDNKTSCTYKNKFSLVVISMEAAWRDNHPAEREHPLDLATVVAPSAESVDNSSAAAAAAVALVAASVRLLVHRCCC